MWKKREYGYAPWMSWRRRSYSSYIQSSWRQTMSCPPWARMAPRAARRGARSLERKARPLVLAVWPENKTPHQKLNVRILSSMLNGMVGVSEIASTARFSLSPAMISSTSTSFDRPILTFALSVCDSNAND